MQKTKSNQIFVYVDLISVSLCFCLWCCFASIVLIVFFAKVSVYEASAQGTVHILAPLLRQFIARGKTIDSIGGRNRTSMLHEVFLFRCVFSDSW